MLWSGLLFRWLKEKIISTFAFKLLDVVQSRGIIRKMDKLRLVFMGTPLFAVPSLEAAIKTGDVVAVITQPDRPSGRKREITPPPVKNFAVEKSVEVYQPENTSSSEVLKTIEGMRPDLVVVVAYGAILKRSLLELPPLGCINIHPSLLPHYRGPCPIEWAIIGGETVTGISCIYMNEEMDAGDIIIQQKLNISISDTKATLSEKLSRLGAEVLSEVLAQFREGKVEAYPQKGEASYAPFIKKEACYIDWERGAHEIRNLVRALNPHLGARTSSDGKKVIIWETALPQKVEKVSEPPGKVVRVSKDIIAVATGSGLLLLKIVQAEGARRQSAAEYIRGHRVEKFRIANY